MAMSCKITNYKHDIASGCELVRAEIWNLFASGYTQEFSSSGVLIARISYVLRCPIYFSGPCTKCIGLAREIMSGVAV